MTAALQKRHHARYLSGLALALLFLSAGPARAQPTPAAGARPATPTLCTALVRRLPNVNARLCTQAQLQDSKARSVKGQPLLLRDVQASDARRRVLVIGAIHGDELSSASVALRWIQLALETPAQSHWRFIPALNPDGLLHRPPQRTNANGVDLNRNFPTPDWSREANTYWVQRTRKDPRRWPGPKPLSEPESRFLLAQIDSFKPDVIVSIHAPLGVLDFDGPAIPPSRLGRLYLDRVGIFPGSLGHYGGLKKGLPVITIELPNAQRTPLDAETRQMWLDLLRWMAAHLPVPVQESGSVDPPEAANTPLPRNQSTPPNSSNMANAPALTP